MTTMKKMMTRTADTNGEKKYVVIFEKTYIENTYYDECPFSTSNSCTLGIFSDFHRAIACIDKDIERFKNESSEGKIRVGSLNMLPNPSEGWAKTVYRILRKDEREESIIKNAYRIYPAVCVE